MVLHAAWLLDQGDAVDVASTRAQVAAIKVVAARLQTRVVDRAMQVFGAMGLSPDTPLAQFWSWGRALHLMDGPDRGAFAQRGTPRAGAGQGPCGCGQRLVHHTRAAAGRATHPVTASRWSGF